VGKKEPRNLLLGWCERGRSFTEAAAELRDVVPWWDEPAFADKGTDEYRAAMNVYVHTGHIPSLHDAHGNGDGRADLLLRPRDGAPQLVEVLSTLDNRMLDAQRRAADLLRDLNGDNPPASSIPVRLDTGWEPPLTRKNKATGVKWRDAAARARLEAHAGAVTEETRRELREVFPSLELGEPSHDDVRGGFHLVSLHARVQSSGEVPYLDRLSDFLGSNERAVHHVEKLEREQAETGADRLHMYLLIASTGEYGNLLPTSPSWLTEGTFTAPEALTDIWLDGGTGQVFWWRRERGWTYHDND
jgi:hypothetical protein